MRIVLFLLSAVVAGWSWDSTIYLPDDEKAVQGVIWLYAGARQVESSPTLLQGVRFRMGATRFATLRNIGLPDFNTSCNEVSHSALLFETTHEARTTLGRSGDTVWNNLAAFPGTPAPLDSLKDRYPDLTRRNAFLGMGWIHSQDVTQGCRSTHQRTNEGFRRIFRYGDIGGPCLMAQVGGFQTEPVNCDTGVHPPCSRSQYVMLRYYAADGLGCRFPDPPAALRSATARGLRLVDALPRPLWQYVLGRDPGFR